MSKYLGRVRIGARRARVGGRLSERGDKEERPELRLGAKPWRSPGAAGAEGGRSCRALRGGLRSEVSFDGHHLLLSLKREGLRGSPPEFYFLWDGMEQNAGTK